MTSPKKRNHAAPMPPKRPAKRPARPPVRAAKKPTEAELAGIRTRSAAAHGGKSLDEAHVLRTWQNSQARTLMAKAEGLKASKRGSAREIDGPRANGPRGKPGSALSGPPSAGTGKRLNHGNPRVGGLPGRSALAPGRARGNPTPGSQPPPRPAGKSMNPKSNLNRVGGSPLPRFKAPSVGFSETNPTRQAMPGRASGSAAPRLSGAPVGPPVRTMPSAPKNAYGRAETKLPNPRKKVAG